MTQRPASPVPWIVVVATAGVLAAGEWMVTGTPAFGSGHILRAPALALLAAGCALLLALRPAPPRVAVLTGWHGLALLLPLAIPLLGLLAAPDHRTASHLLRDAAPWMAMAVLPWGLARTLDRPSLLPHLWRLLVAVGLALALCGLGERLAGHRMAAGFGRPAVAATVFGILLVPAWVHSPFAGGLLRALPPLVFLGAVAASGSRAAWIATAVTGLLTLGPRLPVLRARPRIAPLVAGGIVLLGGLAYAGVVPLPGGNETLEVRRGLHGGALELMAERPLTGHGLGAYPVEALRVRDVAEARLEPGRRPFHAHADLLHVGTEGGVLAALALLAWILTGLLRARALLRDGDPLRRSAGQVGGAALLMPAVVGLADGALLAPGPLLLACVGWATLLRAGPSATEAGAAVRQMPAWIVKGGWAVAALALAGGFGLLAGHARVDHAVQSYVAQRTSLMGALHTGRLREDQARSRNRQLVKTWLVERALRWESDHPEALYQFGVAQAERGKHEDARSLFRRAVAADPGKSEAWLDLARTWALDDRPGDARAALQAARRADPTRFDVALRLAHLRLGPEPVPGDPTPSRSWVPILRAYNEAADLAPDRFENLVAQARVLRRREGTAEAMARADDLLTAAAQATQQRRVPTSMRGTPLGLFFGAATEVQVEAFRLAEALDKPEAVTVGLLEMALSRSAETAASMRREAERFLDTGRQREGEARKEAATTLDPRAFAATDRAYDAATLRLAALLRAARLDVTATHKAARDDKRGKRHRAALARYRALLAWSASETAQITEGGDIRPLRANLLIETAQSATRVGGGHARQYYARAFVLRAAVALDQQDEADALRKAGRALEYDDTSADAWMVRGRALARQGDTKEAADAIARALEFGPHLKGRVQRDEDLADVRQRPDIQTLLR